MNKTRWYVIHAYSGFEHKVAESIKEQASKLGLSEMIDEISVPTQEVIEVKRGARISTEKKFGRKVSTYMWTAEKNMTR